MRYLLITLILIGCSPKISTVTPPRAQAEEFQRVLNADSDLEKQYSGYTQSAFAILWPQNFDSEGKKLLTTVLETAEELQETQSAYTREANRTKRASKRNQCECVLTGICETETPAESGEEIPSEATEPTPTPTETTQIPTEATPEPTESTQETNEAAIQTCTAIEADQLENDERLAVMVRLQRKLKSAVLKMGGYWLEVSTPLVYDFSTGLIDFNGAQFFNKSKERISIKENAFWTLDTVSVEGALKVQGELKLKHNGKVYRGELGFQLPERGE